MSRPSLARSSSRVDEFCRDMIHLLQLCGYPADVVSRHGEFLYDILPPALNSLQLSGQAREDRDPHYPSFMCDDHTPVEFGITWDPAQPLVRISFEPIDEPHELARNGGLNFLSFHRTMTRLEAAGVADFGNFGPLALMAITHPAAIELAPPKVPSQLFLAFDLLWDGSIRVKAYLLPHLRAHEQRMSTFDLLYNTLRCTLRVNSDALDKVRSYVTGCPNGEHCGLPINQQPRGVIISTDVNAHANHGLDRIKVYFRYPTTNFEEILNHLSLGGRLSFPWREPLSLLWQEVLGEDPKVLSNAPDNLTKLTGGTLIYYEFMPHLEPTCNVKVYLPVRHWAPSDAQVCAGVDAILHHWEAAGIPDWARVALHADDASPLPFFWPRYARNTW